MSYVSRPVDRPLRRNEINALTGQVRELLASEEGLSDNAKDLVLAALDGQVALRVQLNRLAAAVGSGALSAGDVGDSDEGSPASLHGGPVRPWFAVAGPDRHQQSTRRPVGVEGRSMLHDALTRLLGLGSIAVAEQTLGNALKEAKAARREAIDALQQVRTALAGSDDPRAARAAALLGQVGTVDRDEVAELTAAVVAADHIRALDAVLAIDVPDPARVRDRLQRIRLAQEAVMAAAGHAENARDGRAQLWGLRREMSELLAVYPNVSWLPGVDEEIMGRYLVARSAARAMAIWMRNADAVEIRMIELTEALAAVQTAAGPARAALGEPDRAWAPIAARLVRWLEYSVEMHATATKVQVLAEAEDWIVRNGKALCAGRLGIVGPIGA